MGTYAKDTTVSPDKTLMEIRATLKRYQASAIAFIELEERVGVAFEMKGRRVRFSMPLPDEKSGRQKASNQYGYKGMFSQKQYDQAIRQRWRALLLCIKAKLESVESGIESFDEAFMAQLVLPSGQTMAEWAQPQIEAAYQTGKMPPLLESGQ